MDTLNHFTRPSKKSIRGFHDFVNYQEAEMGDWNRINTLQQVKNSLYVGIPHIPRICCTMCEGEAEKEVREDGQ